MTTRTRCPVCGGAPTRTPYFEGREWRVLRCSACTFAWIAELVGEPEATAFHWDEDVVSESLKRRPMYEDRLRRIEVHRPAPRTWLDVGCGGGGLLQCAADGGFEVEGIELSPSAETITRTLGIPVHRRVLKEARAALGHSSFGVVSFFHVLEHVHDPVEELLVTREILADEGLLVVEVPYFDTFFWKVFGRRHRHFYRAHLSYFNARSLTTILERCGFELLRLESVPYVMTVAWALRRLGLGGQAGIVPSAIRDRRISVNSGEYLLAVAKRAKGPGRQESPGSATETHR